MKKTFTILCWIASCSVLILGCGGLKMQSVPNSPALTISTIAFGSCIQEQKEAPIWKIIKAEKPEAFLFLGDNIYGDTEDMTVMNEKYDRLFSDKDLKGLLNSTSTLATWDDHDYGENDAGVEYVMKEESKQIFIERFYADSDIAAELKSRPGIYHSRITGPEGKRIQFIMLDTRSFRSELQKLPEGTPMVQGRYMPKYTAGGTILGDEQWEWFEEELSKEADIRFVVTSIQAIPDNHGWEKWGNLPLERDRLFQLIDRSDAKGVILLSGDRHLAEISKLSSTDPKGISYPLYEITASSLNQPTSSRIVEPNQHRITEENYRKENYGFISIDWSLADPQIIMNIKDISGAEVISESVSLSQLQ